MNINEFPQQVNQVISIAETILQGQILGIYLYGSATMNGLRPDSDIDIAIEQLFNSNADSIVGICKTEDQNPAFLVFKNEKDSCELKSEQISPLEKEMELARKDTARSAAASRARLNKTRPIFLFLCSGVKIPPFFYCGLYILNNILH